MAKNLDREKWESLLKLAKKGQGLFDTNGGNIISMAIEQGCLDEKELITFTKKVKDFDYQNKGLKTLGNDDSFMNTRKNLNIDYIKQIDDRTGNLPIHYAMMTINTNKPTYSNPNSLPYINLIKLLIGLYPEGLETPNHRMQTPLGILIHLCKKNP